MITFKQFLTEARMAPLYHATSLRKAHSILSSLTLKANDEDGFGVPFVSFTRSFKYAQQWNDENNRSATESIIFEFDQLALSRNYRLEPTNYFAIGVPPKFAKARYLNNDPVYGTNEYEERIYRDVKNLDRYLVAIHIFNIKSSKILDDHFLIKYKGKYINQ